MSGKNASTRYRLYDETLCSCRFPTLKELIERCRQHDINVTERTVQYDFKQMRKDPPEGFSAKISFNKSRGGYQYDEPGFTIKRFLLSEDELSSLRATVSILKKFEKIPSIQKSIKTIGKFMTEQGYDLDNLEQTIRPEPLMTPAEEQYIEPINNAIINKIKVIIQYKDEYTKDETYEVLPLYLFQDDKHWRVACIDLSVKSLDNDLTLGVDRITNLTVTKEIIENVKPTILVAEKDYVRYPSIELKKSQKLTIVMRFFDHASNEVILNPFHHLQRIVKQEKNFTDISLKVYFNKDDLYSSRHLIRNILSYGDNLEILEPTSFRKIIKNEIEKTNNLYKKKK